MSSQLAESSKIQWRETLESDLEPCLRKSPSSLGEAIVGRARALATWKQILHSDALLSRVVERVDPGRRAVTLGFGSSVLVEPDFIQAEKRDPRPGIVSRIIASFSTGRPVVLSHSKIARANVGPGLDVVFLSIPWWETSEAMEFAEMSMATVMSCVEAHAGYRLHSCTVEVSREQSRSLAASSAGFDIVKEFDESDRVLLTLGRERAASVPTNAANILFKYQEPRLDLGTGEQRLLIVALKGATDQDLAAELAIGLPTVKKLWRTIFAKTEDLAPELFGHLAAVKEGKRGPQKRHLVLSYLREHPEELRPYKR